MDHLKRFIEYRIKTNPGLRSGLFDGFLTLLTNAYERGENGDLGIIHREQLISFTVDDLMAQLIEWWPAMAPAVYATFTGRVVDVEVFVATEAIPVAMKAAALRRYLDAIYFGHAPQYLLLPACRTAVFMPKRLRRRMRSIKFRLQSKLH